MPPHRIFEVTELLSLVAANCDYPTLAKLVCTSRLFFNVAAPKLWGNLQGAHKVLTLLSGTVLGRVRPTDPPPKAAHLSLDAIDFTRFDVYAPLVGVLTIYDAADAKHRIVTWYNWSFIFYLSQQRPLFPHLRRIAINYQRNTSDYEKWVNVLASQKLRALYAPLISSPGLLPYPPSISLPAASVALIRLAGSSPGLEVLEIYPNASPNELNSNSTEQAMTFMGETPYQRLHSSLEQLRALRELCITAIVFETNMFRVVANLPCLESLTVHNVSYQLPEFHSGLVPSSSFPRLARLSLIDIDQENLERVWKSAPLVQKLRSLKVHSSFSRLMTYNWARETFLPLLRDSSPDLTEFLCESRSIGKEIEIHFSLGLEDLK